MKWELDWNDPFTAYLAPFDHLVGDRRTWITLTETVRGIIGSGSLICQRIATQSPILSRVQKDAQRRTLAAGRWLGSAQALRHCDATPDESPCAGQIAHSRLSDAECAGPERAAPWRAVPSALQQQRTRFCF